MDNLRRNARPDLEAGLGPTAGVEGTFDYVSPGFVAPDLAASFPNMIEADRSLNDWTYLRREIPHKWRADRRSPTMGFVSRDEATLLHNMALQFAGKRAIEIGCWRGWSSAHIASAGVILDIVDPVLRDPEASAEMAAMFATVCPGNAPTLYGAESPAGIYEAAAAHGTPWSFAFIDGDHEGDAPSIDAANVDAMAAADAMVVFHDLASPFVAKGLDVLRERGWSVMVFQTMQVMGAAWRGDVTLPRHTPDPRIAWTVPGHLASYPIQGEDPAARAARFEIVLKQKNGRDVEIAAALEAPGVLAVRRNEAAATTEALLQSERDANARWALVAEDFKRELANSNVRWATVVEDVKRELANVSDCAGKLSGELAREQERSVELTRLNESLLNESPSARVVRAVQNIKKD